MNTDTLQAALAELFAPMGAGLTCACNQAKPGVVTLRLPRSDQPAGSATCCAARP